VLVLRRVGVDALVHQLERLPREARAHQLIRLLLETREESIPKQAVLGIWGKLVAGNKGNSAPGTGPKARAKSAASIPIIRSRLLEVGRECVPLLVPRR
jgi:hypothetical protein